VKAVVYKGAFDVALENVTDPRIERAGDAIVRITTANISAASPAHR
jgi:glutathione-independent formaldehyde dehydrogenase